MITSTVNKIQRSIDGGAEIDDSELLAIVKKAYRRTAKIASRSVWGYNEHYASASGAIWKAFGQNFLSDLGFDVDWQNGFAEGFEYTGYCWDNILERIPMAKPHGSPSYNKGFEKGLWIADQVFHHWPDSPDIYSVPEK